VLQTRQLFKMHSGFIISQNLKRLGYVSYVLEQNVKVYLSNVIHWPYFTHTSKSDFKNPLEFPEGAHGEYNLTSSLN